MTRVGVVVALLGAVAFAVAAFATGNVYGGAFWLVLGLGVLSIVWFRRRRDQDASADPRRQLKWFTACLGIFMVATAVIALVEQSPRMALAPLGATPFSPSSLGPFTAVPRAASAGATAVERSWPGAGEQPDGEESNT
jgi:hypothetical protein